MIVSKPRVRHALAGLLASVAVGASAGAQPASAPNLEGVWKIAKPQASLRPVDGPIPFTAEGRKRFAANQHMKARGDYDDYDITTSRCSSPGTPRLMLTPERFKIWQSVGVVTFDFEWNRAIRQIDLRGLPPPPDFMGYSLVPTMTGTSKGHWEGDTLVAVTTDISERTLLDDLTPHTDAIKVTEHLRLVDPDTLEDRIIIDDPATFTRPWESVVAYRRQPAAPFPEDVCLDRHDAHQPAVPSQ
jgi:hypothetical protein